MTVDLALSHPLTFVFMLVLTATFGVGTVAKQTEISVRPSSFLHLWMAAYLVLLGLLMAVTTAMALVLVYDPATSNLRTTWIPPSFAPLAAAVLGVFGFEFLF